MSVDGRLHFKDGDEWQELVCRLLTQRYGLAFETVPDGHGGDLGIEGFSKTDGCAYQCYAPEEPISIADRYDKQRTKITSDLGKLVTNQIQFVRLFGLTKIRSWFLVVPKHDSAKLNLHAKTKAEEIRQQNLPFLSQDFDVSVITDKYFEKEVDEILGRGFAKLLIHVDPESPGAATDWAAANDALVNIIDGKLSALKPFRQQQPRVAYRNQLLQLFLDGSNAMEYLSVEYPELHEAIERRRRTRGRFIAVEGATEALTINKVRADFFKELRENIRGLDDQTLETVSYSAVCGWMLECFLAPKEPI